MIKTLQAFVICFCCLVSLPLTAQTQVLRVKPLASSDDAEQNTTTGGVNIASTDLELGGYDWGLVYKQMIGIRFPNVNLPQGATITRAYIQFSVDETYVNTTNRANINIKAQKGNAATYAAATNNISNRTYTTNQIAWATAAWTVNDQRLVAQQTPDLKAIINEAIQSGFVAGNALAFHFSTTTNGYATAWSFDRANSANHVPELVIEYTPAAIQRTLLTNVFVNEATGSHSVNRPAVDFIEIFNNNANSVRLDSVFLTDKIAKPTKYIFPNQILGAKSFITVDANDLLTAPTATTAAFGISAKSETLYMYQQFNGAMYLIDSLRIGTTTFNTSFGRFPDGSTNIIRFAAATPNLSNNASKQLLDLAFSQQRGIYTAPFQLTLTAPAGTTIRYTTNSTTPNATTGTIYTAPIAINGNTVVKAFAYSATGETKVVTQTYILNSGLTSNVYTAQQLNDALKDLPIVSLGTTASNAAATESPCSFEYINSFGENKSTFIDAGFRIFGNTSKGYPKKNYRVYFKSKYGYSKLKHKIYQKSVYENYEPTDEFDALDLKAGTDHMPAGAQYWGLGGLMMSDNLAHDLIRRMGNKDIHTRFVHVFFNGQYYGIYTIRERFNENYMKSYYGGEDVDYEVVDGTYESSTWPSGIMKQGTGNQWNEVKSFAATNFQALKQKVDMKHYIDIMLMFFVTDMEHEYRAAVHKNYQNSKYVIIHNDTDGFATPTDEGGHNFRYKLDVQSAKGPGDLMVLAGLQGGAFNLEYRTMVRDRVQELFIKPNGLITNEGLTKLMNDSRNLIYNASILETTRWNFYTRDVWNNRVNACIGAFPNKLTTVLNFYRGNNWLHTLQPVSFSKPAGDVNITEKITITNPNANTTVYFTTNGEDVVFDNGIAQAAQTYSTPLSLKIGTNIIKARAYTNGNFGPLTEVIYNVAAPVANQNLARKPNIQITGRKEGRKAMIAWTSSHRVENDVFQLEKWNENTQRYEVVRTYEGAEAQASYFQYADEASQQASYNMYRIALYRNSALKPLYSDEVSLEFNALVDYTLYPNPAQTFVRIDLGTARLVDAQVVVTNVFGQTVAQMPVSDASTLDISIEQLEEGQYLVFLQIAGKRSLQKKLTILR